MKYPFKFSIITAVYNLEPYLEEAVESILCQDIGFKDSVELILVDDGSSDNSGAICDRYQKMYPDNIKVLHKSNGGAASARNAGIALASGRYLNFMDGDDKLSPGTLSAVYDYFSSVDEQVDLVSIPIQFFEKKENAHRLNYKYKDGKNQIIDLNTQYSYVQMSIASSFVKREVLSETSFDTSLPYAEDAKAIMQLLFERPYYGIVPAGCYYYRFRNVQNSALNGSKLRREWYLDCLKNYILWAIHTSYEKFHEIPLFVQYTIMYDLQSRFGVPEIPVSVLSPEEHQEFRDLLLEILSFIDDRIILEQKNLAREQKDYIISLKEGEGAFSYTLDDVFFEYGEQHLYPASSYILKLFHAERSGKSIKLSGSLKFNSRFPAPTAFYVQLQKGGELQTFRCTWNADPEHDLRFDGTLLSQFLDFEVQIPCYLLQGKNTIRFYTMCGGHTVLHKSLRAEPSFPDKLPASGKRLPALLLSVSPRALSVQEAI